jgi:DNA polymerase III delta prime subunit
MPLIYLEPLPRKTTKSDLLEFLDRVGGLERRRVGRIELRGNRATVEVPEGWQGRLAKALDGAQLLDRRIRAWPEGPAAASPGRGREDHWQRLGRLLELESQAEAQRVLERGRRLSPEDAEKGGESLIRLVPIDEEPGLGGRYLVELAKAGRQSLPWTRLGVGSPVLLSPQAAGESQPSRGVVYQRTDRSIGVALAALPDDWPDHDVWRVDLASDDVAVQRQRAALQRAAQARGDRLAELRDVLLGQREPQFDERTPPPDFRPGLNPAQREAVRLALSARDLALIHGPPGTGKTTVVVELIRQAVQRGAKVLASAPSNLAVDNIFEKLLATRVKAVRLGHPARVLPELRAHTLDLLVEEHRDVRLARKLVKDAMALFRKAGRTTRAKPQPGARREAREEARSLLADARRLENQAVEQILNQSDVLCATTTGLDSEVLGVRRFDLAVIDEACQSTEPGCWIPLLRADRLVLAGDHCQLPPTVISREAADGGFGESLFQRMMGLYGPRVARQLTVQYRMNRAIMEFSSREFYDNSLEADAAVCDHLLGGLPGVAEHRLTATPVEFIDTAGADYDEQPEPDGESRLNPREAELVARKVRALVELGVAPGDIGVITPYAAQARLLGGLLPMAGLEIDSVDGFQGREKEAVVISLVRSNVEGQIGFLADVRRMNVALTRARRKLLVVGDTATLCRDPFYARLVRYYEDLGAYRTVWEEDEE